MKSGALGNKYLRQFAVRAILDYEPFGDIAYEIMLACNMGTNPSIAGKVIKLSTLFFTSVRSGRLRNDKQTKFFQNTYDIIQ